MLDTSGIAVLAKVPRTRARTARARAKALSGMFCSIVSVLFLFVGFVGNVVRDVFVVLLRSMRFGIDGSSLVCRARSRSRVKSFDVVRGRSLKFIPEIDLGIPVPRYVRHSMRMRANARASSERQQRASTKSVEVPMPPLPVLLFYSQGFDSIVFKREREREICIDKSKDSFKPFQ